MSKRTDISTILVIGSGPIVIGQACEFDYSGTQACRVLREEGYRVVLANSNPATIMTDPDFADATYVEPLTASVLTRIIEIEKPQAVLPTLGGQTALNLAMELEALGVFEKHGVEMIGADAEAIETAENRSKFKDAMLEIGLDVPRSGVATSMEEAHRVLETIDLPVIIRPAYILGGRGTGIANTAEEFLTICQNGIDASPVGEILVEESITGWKEYELEVMRDRLDNQVIVCGIENVDPMGVHTGDSITVAPIQTLTDVEYQEMRNAAFAVLRRIGVETGGSNVQFAVHPETGRMVVIEMNPRVSRSSALASKATGFPIAKIAAKLAVGYTLDEITNDITTATPASFEPVIDYVVIKIPRWTFEKFPGTTGVLGTSMQSVGEVMAIGRTFPESLQKACRSLEQGYAGLNYGPGPNPFDDVSDRDLQNNMAVATPQRLFQVEEGLRRGLSIEDVQELTQIDPWFIDQIAAITEEAAVLSGLDIAGLTRLQWRRAKQMGFSDVQLSGLLSRSDGETCTEADVRSTRVAAGVAPTFKTVDTCAGEFEAFTPYHYSTYEDETEVRPSEKPRVVILGSGPNRIGQGIEFDYCCVHASFALADAGFETVMINCNPETVSTDYDTSDRLYFEPLTYEDVMNVIEVEDPVGVIVGLGGQTPLKLASLLPANLVLGTSPASIDAAEDRETWAALCERLDIPQPPGGTAQSVAEAIRIANVVGYPVLVRPSYVLGGRAMEIVFSDEDLSTAMKAMAVDGTLGREGGLSAERPVLIDRFLDDATEVDVDALRDHAGATMIGGVMEHVEEAGVHSGDSACVLPPPNLSSATIAVLEDHVRSIAAELEVVGLINVQFAVQVGGNGDGSDAVFVIEANPRASRTVPFVAKATDRPLAKVAARLMAGATLAEVEAEGLVKLPVAGDTGSGLYAVKEAVLPFNRFPETDALLGPEMRSTGEVMGIDVSPGLAFLKAQLGAGMELSPDHPEKGSIFLSLADRDKVRGIEVARRLASLGYRFIATEGTAQALADSGIEVSEVLAKLGDEENRRGARTAVDAIKAGEVSLVINSPKGRGARADGSYIRTTASIHSVPLITTLAAAEAIAIGLAEWRNAPLEVRSLQSIRSLR